jgi:hypothetical protein
MRGEIPVFSLTIPIVCFSAHPYDVVAIFWRSSVKVISLSCIIYTLILFFSTNSSGNTGIFPSPHLTDFGYSV